eukprot:TRINITY_DN5196_c0_g2_i1.p1 TRINITY_DN5196_c0_g2~~TRINITY_DN5196_c0_g2_i1.p1  ORF type:complete len:644 (+),score=166.56 TRINITY_DN5196_c0_g2_i1:87-2018(+)
MAFAKGSIGVLHYVEQTKYKAQKALITAKFNGIKVTESKFDQQKDSKKPCFLEKNPTGKVPFLETDQGCIFSSNSIARYFARCRADSQMYGNSFRDESAIDTWLEFCTHELEVPLMTWVYPVMGLMEDVPEATAAAKADVAKALATVEARLMKSAFLVGNVVSLADVSLVCALREGFELVFDPTFRKPFPKVSAWFEACCAMPQFNSVLGEVKLCKEAATPTALVFAPAPRGAAKAGKAEAEASSAKKGEAKKEAKTEPKKETKKSDAIATTAPPAAATSDGGNVEAQVKAVGDELRALKEKLKSDGLSGKKVNDHADVKALVEKLTGLKQQLPAGGAAPPAATAAAAGSRHVGGSGIEAQIKAVGEEIRAVKEKLKGQGVSGEKLFTHAEITPLVAKLSSLKSQLPSGIEAQINAVGEEIRQVKASLKSQGLEQNAIQEHSEITALISKLNAIRSGSAPGQDIAPAPAKALPKDGPAVSPSPVPTDIAAPSPKSSPKKGPAASPKKGPAASPKTGPTASPNLAPASPAGPSPKSSPKKGPAASPKKGPAASPKLAPADPAGPSPKSSPKKGPAASPKMAPSPSPKDAPAAEDDIAVKVKSIGDQVRVLKEKLKGEGLSGKKINQHADVVALVSEMNALKAKM